MADNPRCIYFFPLDHAQEEGEPIPIELTLKGEADLSKCPPELRLRLEHGVRRRFSHEPVYPRDGEAFLQALLDGSTQYFRFRSTPQRISAKRADLN